jgi:hypothetical protein
MMVMEPRTGTARSEDKEPPRLLQAREKLPFKETLIKKSKAGLHN